MEMETGVCLLGINFRGNKCEGRLSRGKIQTVRQTHMPWPTQLQREALEQVLLLVSPALTWQQIDF